jgi:hypothetical protein
MCLPHALYSSLKLFLKLYSYCQTRNEISTLYSSLFLLISPFQCLDLLHILLFIKGILLDDRIIAVELSSLLNLPFQLHNLLLFALYQHLKFLELVV